MTIAMPVRTRRCRPSSARSEAGLSAIPSAMHHVTIGAGPAEPKGRGASVMTAKRMNAVALLEAASRGRPERRPSLFSSACSGIRSNYRSGKKAETTSDSARQHVKDSWVYLDDRFHETYHFQPLYPHPEWPPEAAVSKDGRLHGCRPGHPSRHIACAMLLRKRRREEADMIRTSKSLNYYIVS
jgi:hypothetical protein